MRRRGVHDDQRLLRSLAGNPKVATKTGVVGCDLGFCGKQLVFGANRLKPGFHEGVTGIHETNACP